ncbi:MAG TPA: hypothetical protein VK907_05350 [Phnomibacter sp.]|nr:hypothetical protein [Phnomibacter sp.]
MTTPTPKRHLFGWLCLSVLAIGLALAPTFRTQAQNTQKQGKEKTGKAATGKQPATDSRTGQMDGLTREELAKAQAKLEKAMADLEQKDWAQVEKQITESLAKIDLEKMQVQMQQAFSEEKLAKAIAQMEKAFTTLHENDKLLGIDKETMGREMQKATRELEKLKTLQLPDMEKEISQLKEDLSRQKFDFAKEMEKAKIEMDKAREQLHQMAEGLRLMEADGLLEKGEPVTIDWEEDIMILNGKPQTKEVSDKYRKYFPKGGPMKHLEKRQPVDI